MKKSRQPTLHLPEIGGVLFRLRQLEITLWDNILNFKSKIGYPGPTRRGTTWLCCKEKPSGDVVIVPGGTSFCWLLITQEIQWVPLELEDDMIHVALSNVHVQCKSIHWTTQFAPGYHSGKKRRKHLRPCSQEENTERKRQRLLSLS